MERVTRHQFMKLSPRAAELSKLFLGRKDNVEVAPGGWIYPAPMEKYIEDYISFEFENTDVIVYSFPKSGTTWTQEVVWTMRNNPNLDNPGSKQPLSVRTPVLGDEPFIEHIDMEAQYRTKFSALYPNFDHSCGLLVHALKMTPHPRTIKTHLPLSFMSPTVLEKGKMVYVIRDPRDVCISFHHHCRLFTGQKFRGNFDQYVDAFIEDAVTFGPYWSHVKQAWAHRDHPNMHIIFYEKMKKHPKEELVRLNDFLGTKLTDQQMENILRHTSFEEMKKRDDHVVAHDERSDFLDMELVEAEGGFFRKGTAGGWRNVLTQDQKNKFEVWITKNCPDTAIMENILNP